MSDHLGISKTVVTPSQVGGASGVEKSDSPVLKTLTPSDKGGSELPKSPPTGETQKPIQLRQISVSSSGGGGGDDPTNFDRLPTRRELEGLISKFGPDVTVTVRGMKMPAVGLSQFLQASGHLEEASRVSPQARRTEVRGDDRQIVVTNPLTGGRVTLDLRGAELFAFAIERLDPGAAKSIREDIGRVRSDVSGVQVVLREPRMEGFHFLDFATEMLSSGAMKGENYDGSPMPTREEMQRGHGLFIQAMKTPKDVPLIFGRTPEVNSTNAGFFKYTSERMDGSVLMPEKWNLFLNSCWLMGGVKSDVSFAPLTVFQATDKHHDFRSSETSKGTDGLPNRFIITVSVAEIEGLKSCGYVLEPHEVFGSILVPGKDSESVERRQNVTMKELNQIMYLMALAQASDNVTGHDRVATYQTEFLGQHDPSVRGTLKETVDLVTSTGLKPNDPGNGIVRKGETKVLLAYQRIEQAGGSFTGTMYVEKAWQEVTQGVLLIADDEIRTRGLDPTEANAVRTEVIQHLELERAKGKTTFGLNQSDVREFVAGRAGATDAQRNRTTLQNNRIALMEGDFRRTLREVGVERSEHDTMWAQFQGWAKRIDNPSIQELTDRVPQFIAFHLTNTQSYLAMPMLPEPTPLPVVDRPRRFTPSKL